jgi:hypothetical protein
MTDQERDLTPNTESTPEPPPADVSEDDLRYAPPLADIVDELGEPPLEANEPAAYEYAPMTAPLEMDGALDIEAALAAVSNISDMVAEREAAEQARLAAEAAREQLAAERQARLEHPERFFPVPPMLTLQRGQLTSVVLALALMGLGAWLTFTLTTTQTLPEPPLLVGALGGALLLVLLAHWLSTGRWARGTLFFALLAAFAALTVLLLSQPGAPGLLAGWPLVLLAPGLAFPLVGFLSRPRERRFILPGIALIVAGLVGFAVTNGLIAGAVLQQAATLWPAALVIVVILWLLPAVFRQRG